MNQVALRRFLLDLLGTAALPDFAAADANDWTEIDHMAAQHRLQPLLHSLHREREEVPTAIRGNWRAAHRGTALQALVQQAELAETCALLESKGFAPIALKGAWLSRHAYAEAAQRPMRDLDLLVPMAGVMDAFAVLLDAGYRQAEPPEMTLADAVRLDKHMPPLIAPRGTRVELHHRLWEADGRLDHASPEQAAPTATITDRDRIRFLTPQDQLAHLIVHAVYSHRLDCGPLVLSDIYFLIRKEKIDWPRFWTDAVGQGWRKGARLMLELVAHYRPGAPLDFAPDRGPAAPAALLNAAPDLLLQDLDRRASAGFAAAVIKGGSNSLVNRILARRSATGDSAASRTTGGPGGALGWAGSRLLRSLRDLARRDVRQQSQHLAALSTWLDQ